MAAALFFLKGYEHIEQVGLQKPVVLNIVLNILLGHLSIICSNLGERCVCVYHWHYKCSCF